jgi:hypothetical protein
VIQAHTAISAVIIPICAMSFAESFAVFPAVFSMLPTSPVDSLFRRPVSYHAGLGPFVFFLYFLFPSRKSPAFGPFGHLSAL